MALAGIVISAQLPEFRVASDRVMLAATAVDGRGRVVQDLKPGEFRVFEDGRQQMLVHFGKAQTMPARILLLVDASGSMGGTSRTASTRMAVVQLLAALGPEVSVALASFDHEYRESVPLTRDRDRILAGFDALTRFGSTALHDALDRAARELTTAAVGRRAVVVLTDGVDTSSRKSADEVIERSRALDVPIYALSVLSPLDDPGSPLFSGRERPSAPTAGNVTLARYAALSGGAAFVVSDFGSLRDAAHRIASELGHQYLLGYDPPQGPPRFRRVEVRSTRKGISVRTRSGYLPTPSSSGSGGASHAIERRFS
jgi:VWFA-related protein